MKLRDHPLMNYYGFSHWSSAWISLNGREGRMSRSEVGVLIGARKSEIRTDGIILIMKYNGNLYCGTLAFPEIAFFDEMFDLMKKSIGLSIHDIGDTDLSHTPFSENTNLLDYRI
jgi:hypothetical protein